MVYKVSIVQFSPFLRHDDPTPLKPPGVRFSYRFLLATLRVDFFKKTAAFVAEVTRLLIRMYKA